MLGNRFCQNGAIEQKIFSLSLFDGSESLDLWHTDMCCQKESYLSNEHLHERNSYVKSAMQITSAVSYSSLY